MKRFRTAFLVATLSVTGLVIALVSIHSTRVVASAYGNATETTDRAKLLAEIISLRNQLNAREQEYLSPGPADRAAFGKSANTSEGGLIRLMPRGQAEGQLGLSVRGGGAYYSFTRLVHDYGYGSDLSFENGSFTVGFAGADYGYVAAIGDVPLEAVTPESRWAQFLIELESPRRFSEARSHQRRSGEGIEQDGIVYKNRVGAAVGCTYVLRSVGVERSDVVVAFRVMKRDDDGSLIILWKMLRQFPASSLVRDAQ